MDINASEELTASIFAAKTAILSVYQTIPRHIQETINRDTDRCEDLKSHMWIYWSKKQR
jgi:hypothetical protein